MGAVERKSEEILNKEPFMKIPSSFMQQVLTEAENYRDLETGGKIFGIEYTSDNKHHIIPLVSFTPVCEEEILRREQLVDIGGSGCILYEKWAWVFWEGIADSIPDPNIRKTELKLLGTWHLQPKGSAHYSKTDILTAKEFFNKNPDRDNLLFMILSEDNPKAIRNYEASLFMNGKDRKYEINCYHLYKDKEKVRNLTPVIINSDFPKFPKVPWFAKVPKLYDSVIDDLQDNGFDVNPEIRIIENLHTPQLCLTAQSRALCNNIYFRLPNDFDETKMIFIRNRDFNEENIYEMQIFLEDYNWEKISDALKYYMAFNT